VSGNGRLKGSPGCEIGAGNAESDLPKCIHDLSLK
jgi:hypothetical protein